MNELRPAARRPSELAETDPQLQALMPDADVGAAVRQPGLSYQQVITTILDGYAERHALGERGYDVGRDPDTGRTRRDYLPRFDMITYGELHDRVKRVAATWGE
ncbi:MAG TPA: hypothetical protein VF441_01830, partial [Acidimicrobiia bacterium]